MSKSTKKCRIFKDGNSWCCVGPKFKNIQESASGFGDTAEEAYNDYQADIIAMKAAKKLAKGGKKLKAVSKKETAVSKKFVAILETQVKVFFISGLTPKKVLEKALKFNLTMECPLGNDLVKIIVSELSEGPWLETLPTLSKKKSDKGSRNTRIHKCVVKGFEKGLTRAEVITKALKKNSKFNTALCTAEVTNLVRIEWERLNPPSK